MWTLASLAILHCKYDVLPQIRGTIVGAATLFNAIFIPIESRFRPEEHEIQISQIQFLPLMCIMARVELVTALVSSNLGSHLLDDISISQATQAEAGKLEKLNCRL